MEVIDPMRSGSFAICLDVLNTSSRSSKQSSRVRSQDAEFNQSSILDDVDCIAAGRMALELTIIGIQH